MEVTIYSTQTCPKCKMLKKKMDDKGIVYTDVEDVGVMRSMSIVSVPWLNVDSKMMDFNHALKWVMDYNKEGI